MTYDPRTDPNFVRIRAAVERAQAPAIAELRRICEAIGYGRVIQLAEQWMDEKNPGWVRIHHELAMKSTTDEETPGCPPTTST